ncbi:hypothetical protein P168DRAFT_289935 [Aspergillus campestris IBT 28561]|uniref:Uncharacterized protein n=1 Tax=Aspergillus campestris (strain IBT 28561) TaxID=1392248 RepID=A0A2I1D5G9_ASPC2|nr:uncharacterized protein P168DRAFT_289935 [Aspergillus campestris IBT 28561]PKY05119.1 hypothetical protein P168DRAFT_289935 [Aspergillus campestris IBT 28561]
MWRRKKDSSSQTPPELKEKSKAYDDSFSETTTIVAEKKDIVPTSKEIVKPPPPKKPTQVAGNHYGIRVTVPFDAKIHSKKDKFWDPLKERWYASNQLKWLLEKDASYTVGASNGRKLHHTWKKNRPMKMHVSVHACRGTHPPTRLGSADTVPQGRILVDCVVDIAGRLKSPEFTPRKNSAGVKYNDFYYKIHATITKKGRLLVQLVQNGNVFWSIEVAQPEIECSSWLDRVRCS